MSSAAARTAEELRFAALLGQERAKEFLKRAHTGRRMAHAFLFRGPAGTGKLRAARTFAAYINCAAPNDDDACGRCPSCLKIRSGNHPDLLLVEPDGVAVKISQVRELIKALAFPPFEAAVRVVIMTDIHTMRREAANSLLKTLEEPPAATIFILLADDAGDILPTILSRCQEVPFFALPYGELAEELGRREPLDRDAARTLAGIAEGSLGRSLLLHSLELLPFRRELLEGLLALSPHDPARVEQLFSLAERAAQLKEQLPELFGLLRSWYRDLALYQAGVSEERLINQDLLPLLAKAARRWPPAAIDSKVERLRLAEKQLARNCNRAQVCEMLFFALL